MIPAKQAEQLILDLVRSLDPDQDSEILSLSDCIGRVLAKPVTSQLDFPHWDNSAMDGYAVRYEDVQQGSSQNPVTLEIVEEIPAGVQPQKSIQSGQAARILTGAVMPAGADTVVMQEDTQREPEKPYQVTILAAPKPQAFVRHQGAFYQAGEPLLQSGLKLQAPEIAVLAAAQCAQVSVFRRLRVAILSTGDELVPIDCPLQPGQIVDSNRYALTAAIAQLGATPISLGIVPDDPEALKQAISQAIAAADVVLSSGGVSVGDYDYVDTILADLGAEIHIRSVAVQPGKPLTVATFPSQSSRPTLYFGLPGNPVSALVSFWRFVQPALKKFAGFAPPCEPAFVQATTRHDLKTNGKREVYLWGKLLLVDGYYEFELAGGSHSSGNLINLAGTSGFAVVPLGETKISAGSQVRVMLVS